jgi:hypothetical protein
MYIQGGKNINLRPDRCGIIFEKLSDVVIHGTYDVKSEMTDQARDQINSFMQQGYKVILGASDFRKPMVWQPITQT